VDSLRRNRKIIVFTVLIVSALGFIYYRTIAALIAVWNTDPDYSHGYVIPVVSLYMIWYIRERLSFASLQPLNGGLFVLILGVLLQVVGFVGSEHFLQGLSLIVIFFGISLYIGGWIITRALCVPIGFLIFMIPLPSVIWNKFTFFLKLQSSDMAVTLLKTFSSIPLIQNGNIIVLTGGSLEVADACSGIRSLISLTAVAVLIAFIGHYALWKKYVLVFAAIPIAFVANVTRVILMVVYANHYGIGAIESFVHPMSGAMIFIVGFALLYGLNAIFSHDTKKIS